jgi:DNA-binding PucR family transcriptional regulator
MLSDDLLATSLRELFLAPLEQERDGGRVLLETLRIYFSADRKVSSAAAALGVTRRTVANRLRTVETRLGCSLRSVAAEMEAALQLRNLQVRVAKDPSVHTAD